MDVLRIPWEVAAVQFAGSEFQSSLCRKPILQFFKPVDDDVDFAVVYIRRFSGCRVSSGDF